MYMYWPRPLQDFVQVQKVTLSFPHPHQNTFSLQFTIVLYSRSPPPPKKIKQMKKKQTKLLIFLLNLSSYLAWLSYRRLYLVMIVLDLKYMTDKTDECIEKWNNVSSMRGIYVFQTWREWCYKIYIIIRKYRRNDRDFLFAITHRSSF